MKALILLFLSIVLVLSIAGSNSAFGIPDCHHERDLAILWPCYDDKTKYYQCVDLNERVLMPCGSGTWFDFNAQSCKRPSDWKPIFYTTIHPPNPEPNPEPEPKPDPETKPPPKPEPEKNRSSHPPIVTRKTTKKANPERHTTKYDGPPIIIRTKLTTRESHKIPPTPIPTAPSDNDVNKSVQPKIVTNSERNEVTQKKTSRTRPPVPIKVVTKKDMENDKEKVTIRKRKTKMVPTRVKRS